MTHKYYMKFKVRKGRAVGTEPHPLVTLCLWLCCAAVSEGSRVTETSSVIETIQPAQPKKLIWPLRLQI